MFLWKNLSEEAIKILILFKFEPNLGKNACTETKKVH